MTSLKMLKLILIAGCIVAAMGVQRRFKFVDTLTKDQDKFWVWRSQATGLKTLRLVDEADDNKEHTVQFTVCTLPLNDSLPVAISVDDIQYSNDGPSDMVYLKMDGVQFGVFETAEKWMSGHEWNVFKNSGKIGQDLPLGTGAHTLQIRVVTDKWGVEFDSIRINAENQNPVQDLFCGAVFIE